MLESRYFNLSGLYSDASGNTFTVEGVDQDTVLLQKISPDGVYVKSYPFVRSLLHHIFIDHQGRIHVSLLANNGVHSSVVLSNDLQLIPGQIGDFYALAKFQLPGDDAVYYYMEDEGHDLGEKDVRIILFKDGQQLWERAFTFTGTPVPFLDFDLNETTGDLLASSVWYNVLGQLEPDLHRFSINNQYSRVTINNGMWWEGMYHISLMPNDNAFIVYEGRLDLYDPAGVLLQTIPIGNAPSGGNFFKKGRTYYRAHNGTLEGFSQNGFPLFAVANESFSLEPAGISIDSNGIATTASTFGEIRGGGYDNGWRWTRGRIQTLDLSKLLSSEASEPTATSIRGIKCLPNPAVSMLQIDLQDFVGKPIRLSLSSSGGQLVLERTFTSLETSTINLNIMHLSRGQYFLSVVSPEEIRTQKLLFIGH